jgi:mono/diheme cytochrome c family protein
MDNIKEFNIDPNEEVVETRKEKLNLTGIYALIYFVILVTIISIGTMYLNKLGYMTSEKLVPFTLSDTAQVITAGELPIKKGSTTPPVDIFAYENPGTDVIEMGKQLYASNCVSCHGETGEGNGPAGASLNPPPRNFTNMDNWKNGATLEGLYKTMQEGIPNTGMASFANLLPEQRLALIFYVRTFSPQFPPVTRGDLQKLEDTYHLSQGQKESNQIPLMMAMEKVLAEYSGMYEKINSTIAKVEGDNSPGAQILKRISSDITSSVTALYADNSWTSSESTFIAFISINPVQKGFKTRIEDFSSEEWSTLFGYLKSIINNGQVEKINNENNEQKSEGQDQPK